MSEPDSTRDRPRPRVGRLLSGIDRWASRPLTALIAVFGAAAWVLVSVAVGFPGRWETVFQTLVAALTLTMVFVIQHTQARQEAATQRKLDEILQAMPGADNSLLTLEHASDDELRATGDLHRGIRQAALGEQQGSRGAGRLAAVGKVHEDQRAVAVCPVDQAVVS